MKSLPFFVSRALFCLLSGCSGSGGSMTQSAASPVSQPDANVTHKDGWTIVSKIEGGDRVYWFLAPDVDGVSPAMFKKVIHVTDNREQETKTVSKCDAPKQQCTDLMQQFKKLSDKYQ